MRTFLSTLLAIAIFSCNSNTEVTPNNNSTQPTKTKPTPDCSVALKFINDYTAFISSPKKPTKDLTWVEQNPSLTTKFKLTYKTLLDSARKVDPEIGLGFDPILDAQDYPNKGFDLLSCDTTLGYVKVKGKDWQNFVLTLKVVQQNNQWLVDGAGVINIPIDVRIKDRE
jgi:hypothetical protein